MFFLTSPASLCLRLRTISTARLTAETSIAAVVMMVLAGAGSACVCDGALGTGSDGGPSCLGSAGFTAGLAAAFDLSGFFAAFFSFSALASGFVSGLACALASSGLGFADLASPGAVFSDVAFLSVLASRLAASLAAGLALFFSLALADAVS